MAADLNEPRTHLSELSRVTEHNDNSGNAKLIPIVMGQRVPPQHQIWKIAQISGSVVGCSLVVKYSPGILLLFYGKVNEDVSQLVIHN